MKDYIIAHDLGTSGNKATLFTTSGRMIKSVTHAYDVRFFNSNWAEQNPADWWASFCACNKSLLKGEDASRVAAISFSGQMMGCLCVDQKGNPLRDSIIWADMRAKEQEKAIQEKIPLDEFYHLTGHRASCSYSVEKFMWLRDNEPDIYKNTYKMLNAKDYIITKLTGRFLTDCSDASGTNVFDINKLRWSEKLIDITGIDGDKLPEAVPSTTVAGEVPKHLEEECGLPAGTKIVMGGGDGVCASVGAGSVAPGITYCCLGSSSWISTTSEHAIFDPKRRTFNWAHIVPGMITPNGTMQAAGASFNWALETLLKKDFELAENPDDVMSMVSDEIQNSKVLSNALLFLPYLLGERSPRWNPNARGAFIGLKMEHTRGDLLRSVVEGVAMNLRIILDIFRANMNITELTAIGGMVLSPVICGILADTFDVDIVIPSDVKASTSIGAAVTAAVGIGAIDGFGEAGRFISMARRVRPNAKNAEQYKAMGALFDKAYSSLTDLYDSLAQL